MSPFTDHPPSFEIRRPSSASVRGRLHSLLNRDTASGNAVAVLTVAASIFLPACRKDEPASVQTGSAPTSKEEAANCLYDCPKGSPETNKKIARSIYTLSVNPETKMADWAAYCITKETLGKKKAKAPEREFEADPDLPDEARLEPEDYKSAHERLGVDRGHQVPLGSCKGSEDAHTTNYLSNITPQMKDLNQGPWNDVEKQERVLATRKKIKRVCVLTGPLYEKDMPKLPLADEDHKVPSGYWKVVAVEKGDSLKTAAFIMDQSVSKKYKYCNGQVSIDDIEERAKLDLFPAMDDAKEKEMEALKKGKLSKEMGCSSSKKSGKKSGKKGKKGGGKK